MKKSFFEYLGIADVERVHSQILAWIFSVDCDAIDANQKNELLKNIFHLDNVPEILSVQTERNGIDILIETKKEIIVIENKIKSSLHSDQLSRYEEYCKETFPTVKPYYYYLTLIGEDSFNGNWKRISYSNIYKHLIGLKLKKDVNHSIILKEYLIFLNRLESVIIDFTQNVKSYEMVFKDGNKRKEDKIRAIYNNDNEKFIADNQLETILQRSFLISIVDDIKSAVGFVNETRGAALVDFQIQEEIHFQNRKYATLIQLQKDNIKFAFAIQGRFYVESDKGWIEQIIPMMEQLSKSNYFQYNKCNKPKSKAFVSISKKLLKNYWLIERSELIDFLETEIENGKKMNNQLNKLIESI